MVVEPGFSVRAPNDEAWKLKKNRRVRGEPIVVFSHRQRGVGALTFRVMSMPDNAARVPLEVLAEALFMTGGRASGIRASLGYSTQLVVGDQQAVATMGTWTIRPVTQQVAQVVVRSPDGLIVVTLVAPQEHITSLTRDFDQVLRDFMLVTDAQLDPFLLDTIPFEEPAEDPGRFGP